MDSMEKPRQRLKGGLHYAALKGFRPEKDPGVIRRSPY